MKLHELAPPEGARHRRKRIGRGAGSGFGKTATRGHKGQRSRAGGGKGPAFEGGQMPLQRRLPKRGFTSFKRKRWVIVNLGTLAEVKAESIDLTTQIAAKKGGRMYAGVKVLGEGLVRRPLTVRAHSFSASARRKIEAAGGNVEVAKR